MAGLILWLVPALAGAAPAAFDTSGTGALDALRSLVRENRLAEADSSARAFLARLQRVRGTDSLQVANTLDVLLDVASRRMANGAPETRAFAERLVGLRERYGGPDDPRLPAALTYLAGCRRAIDDPRGALGLYQRAQAQQERTLGPDDLEVSRTLNRVCAVYRALGQRAEARAALERAVAIREKRLPADHPDLALVLGNLALMDMEDGEFTRARERFERTLAIREKNEGPDGAQVGITLLNLASLHSKMGDLEEANAQLERCVRVLSARIGPHRWEVAQARANLGLVRLKLHDAAGAEALLRGALADLDTTGQGTRALRAEMLVNLASAVRGGGRLAEADSLYHRGLAMEERAYSPDHWEVAKTLRALGALQLERGDAAGARTSYERALAIDEAAFGAEHPSVAEALAGRAAAEALSGERRLALSDALRAERIGREHLRLTARALPEREAMEYAATRQGGMSLAVATLAADPGDTTAVGEVWDALVRSRALVLDEMASRRRSLALAGDTATDSLVRLDALRHERLANLFVRGIADSASGFRAAIADARRACEAADAELAEHSTAFRRARANESAGLAEVRAALPPGAALVAFARYARNAAGAAADRDSADEAYAAFVQEPGAPPRVVLLGPAARIDALVGEWRVALGDPAAPVARRLRAGRSLRRAIWDPLAAPLGPAARVFVVPEGALHLVNFGALPAAAGGYLVERGPLIHDLSTERELLREPDGVTGHGLLAVGGADFDRVDSPGAGAVADARPASFRGARPGCDGFRELRCAPLPATRTEVAAIAAVWNRAAHADAGDARVQLLTAAQASEAQVKEQAPHRRCVHLATHGFFLDRHCDRMGADENPLLHSGLLLAGANQRERATAGEDGVLTAEEISAMDLAGVETVVLSACESGLGSVVTGEGVFGLRRAFEVAGVRTLVMSLWNVRDLDAQRWMRAFYEARYLRREGCAEAVRDASLRLLREQRAAGEPADPAAWGAFIASGDWR